MPGEWRAFGGGLLIGAAAMLIGTEALTTWLFLHAREWAWDPARGCVPWAERITLLAVASVAVALLFWPRPKADPAAADYDDGDRP